jgi:DNA-binding NtrC family response regulator
VHIYLPAVLEADKKETKIPVIVPQKMTDTILLIEDEEMVMGPTRLLLERLGYRVLGAGTGEEAISISRNFDGRIDLAILDILLPDMNGKALYPLLMEARPNLKVIVCTGYSL